MRTAADFELTRDQWAAYEVFLSRYRDNLRRIAYRTGGEHSLDDVGSEALFMAMKMRDTKGFTLDFSNAAFLDVLMRYLYQSLVPYADTTIRYSTRFEHGVGEELDAPNPIVKKLVSDGGRDPLAHLIDKEEALGADLDVVYHPSLAAAYVLLLQHFNHHIVSVAEHLLVSLSHTYRRISHARTLAVHQQPLTLPLPRETFIPGPWRKFKLKRQHVQLTFDFEDAPTFLVES